MKYEMLYNNSITEFKYLRNTFAQILTDTMSMTYINIRITFFLKERKKNIHFILKYIIFV
jgi:hypothetical protein